MSMVNSISLPSMPSPPEIDRTGGPSSSMIDPLASATAMVARRAEPSRTPKVSTGSSISSSRSRTSITPSASPGSIVTTPASAT